MRDQVDAALAAATRTGWDGLCAAQREYLDDFWEHADVEIDGDAALQQAVRFALFQVLQASARAEQRAIPAKGLTGRGYDGHTFWDSEAYSLRMLTYTDARRRPRRAALAPRTLELAQARAQRPRLRRRGVPMADDRGEECSGYWPAGTAAIHVNADIADAVRRYVAATGDESSRRAGLDLLVETARLWCSVGHHDSEGAFRIDGVTGPDEYSALADNNVFTNLMAARNLRAAADVGRAPPASAQRAGVDDEQIASWRHAADTMTIPYDDRARRHRASGGLHPLPRTGTSTHVAPTLPCSSTTRTSRSTASQVVKQADLVFALYACGDQFDAEQKARDFAYYEPITVRDSSLSASIQAIVAAEIGHSTSPTTTCSETAFVDLHD